MPKASEREGSENNYRFLFNHQTQRTSPSVPPLRGTHKMHHDVFVPLYELLQRIGRQFNHVLPITAGRLHDDVSFDTVEPE